VRASKHKPTVSRNYSRAGWLPFPAGEREPDER
jgi:hypothetical protein